MTSIVSQNLVKELQTPQVVGYQKNAKECDHDDYGLSLDSLQVLGRHLQYRGEGNSNIVVALPDDLRVVRLSKVKTGGMYSEDWSRLKRKIEREVDFANNTFSELLGPEFVGSVRMVQLSLSTIKELNDCLRSLRPAYRLHKELGVPYATSHTDFARIHSYSHPSSNPDYCIEIKPKQGWLSNMSLTGESTLCTFCLNQYLKLSTSKITSRSNYCPLDLFSGEPRRMVRSVMALVKNPQNNFRIFRDGVLVYGDNQSESLGSILQEWVSPHVSADSASVPPSPSDLSNMLYLICTALLTPQHPCTVNCVEVNNEIYKELKREIEELLSHSNGIKDLKPIPGCVGSVLPPLIPRGCILSRILGAQRLGVRGENEIYKLFRKICPHHSSNLDTTEAECPSRKCLEEEVWLDEISESQMKVTDVEEVRIEDYLLAATAKDCSIMMTFSRLSEEERLKSRRRSVPSSSDSNDGFLLIDDMFGSCYKLRIGVADLDPKPVTSIARHYFRDLDMSRAFASLNEGAADSTCDDDE